MGRAGLGLDKGMLILIVIGGILVWILYAVIRSSPRRWWFYFWLISLPIIVFLSFVEPFVLEPMFFTVCATARQRFRAGRPDRASGRAMRASASRRTGCSG